jgi:leucyl-tRNA---protein transferase
MTRCFSGRAKGVVGRSMSNIRSPQQSIQFFHRSGPMACPYREGFVERKLFTRLPSDPVVAQRLNSDLSKGGFRRSHDVLYRPICDQCTACIPVRVPVNRFRPSKSMRRAYNASKDLVMTPRSARASAEDYALFKRYQWSRHRDSDMAKMTENDYRAMVEEGSAGTVLFCFREEKAPDASDILDPGGTDPGDLVGVMIADRLDDGYSAVYSFFNADGGRFGLGTTMIMALIEQCKREGLDHVYLGYWIKESQKMLYKSRFSPLEYLSVDGWRDM